jgi:hypothetical protein
MSDVEKALHRVVELMERFRSPQTGIGVTLGGPVRDKEWSLNAGRIPQWPVCSSFPFSSTFHLQ